MICPRCQASLLRKERTGNVCSKCRRPFALDPRVDGRGMHDTRVRRIAEQATDGGRRKVTVTQLGYLCRTANRTWAATPASGRSRWIGRSVGALLAAGLVALGIAVQGAAHAALIWWAGAATAAVGYAVARGGRYRPARRAGAYLTPSPRDFRTMIRVRWVKAYGRPPRGIVDEERYRETGRERGNPGPGTVTLLCPDRAVRVFLAANRFPRELELTLAAEIAELPATGPVVVLHDASARGLGLVAQVRADRPGAVVVDAGLPVAAVLDNPKAVTLHDEPPAAVASGEADWLRRLARRAPEEARWLAEGWVSPVAAVPPALLAPAVERAVRRARATADAARREAAAIGFLSQPPATTDGD